MRSLMLALYLHYKYETTASCLFVSAIKPTEPAPLQLADEHILSCLFKLCKKKPKLYFLQGLLLWPLRKLHVIW